MSDELIGRVKAYAWGLRVERDPFKMRRADDLDALVARVEAAERVLRQGDGESGAIARAMIVQALEFLRGAVTP